MSELYSAILQRSATIMQVFKDLLKRLTSSSIDIQTATPQKLHSSILYRKSWSDIFLTKKQRLTLRYFRWYSCEPKSCSGGFIPSVADYFDLLDRLLINDSWYMSDKLGELMDKHKILNDNLEMNYEEVLAVKERSPHPDLSVVLEVLDEQIKENEDYIFMLKGLKRRRYTGFDPVQSCRREMEKGFLHLGETRQIDGGPSNGTSF